MPAERVGYALSVQAPKPNRKQTAPTSVKKLGSFLIKKLAWVSKCFCALLLPIYLGSCWPPTFAARKRA
jgi:hypothetical protein